MKSKTQEQKVRLRQFLLVLPIIIVFCAALVFVALGGGKDPKDRQAENNKGINTDLPGAKFGKQEPQDKLSLYDQAARDSIKARSDAGNPLFSLYKPDSASANAADANAVKINQRLADISREISRPEAQVKSTATAPLSDNSGETAKLEKMLRAVNNKASEDPELRQLSTMLDKIMAIQNPSSIPSLSGQEKPSKPDSTFKAIPAVIEGNQKVVQGGIVKIRLTDTIVLEHVIIPRGQFLYGSCNIVNQRLLLDIKNIRLGTSIIPVDLSVFSLDGLPGIDAPEAELAEAGSNGTANAVQSMEFLPMDQTIATQAASAGISAAKSLISRKARKIRVKLHGGETVLLRNNHPSKL